MKKTILFIIMLILIIPVSVNAGQRNSNKCKAITGDGTQIGDEIVCGDEHFYVIEYDGANVRMLSKYNLLSGINAYVLTFNHEEVSNLSTYEEYATFCDNKYQELNLNEKYFNEENKTNLSYTPPYRTGEDGSLMCYYFFNNNVDEIKQDKNALGAHGGSLGKPEPDQIGVLHAPGNTIISDFSDIYGGHFVDGTVYNYFSTDIYAYEDYLDEKDYIIENIELLSATDLNNIIKKLTDEDIPFEDWYDNKIVIGTNDFYDLKFTVFGKISELLPEGYEWLYSTTYWLQSAEAIPYQTYSEYHSLFIDTLGYLCSSSECLFPLGAGIRPVVTISKTNIETYNVKSKDFEYINIDLTRYTEGEPVIFEVKDKNGSKVEEITIIDEQGNSVPFTLLENGTYEFVMPSSDVTISLVYSDALEIPDTLKNMSIIGIIGILLVIGTGVVILIKRK